MYQQNFGIVWYSICRVSKTEMKHGIHLKNFSVQQLAQSSNGTVFLEMRVETFQEQGNKDTTIY